MNPTEIAMTLLTHPIQAVLVAVVLFHAVRSLLAIAGRHGAPKIIEPRNVQSLHEAA